MLRAKEVAKWFLLRNKVEQDQDECVESISNLKLQKLLYYAQGIHLAVTDEILFEEDIYAWKHGPVVPDVYDEYKVNKGNPIEVLEDKNNYELTIKVQNDKKAADTLEFVFNEYGQYSAWGLRNMTHNERPWKETPLQNIIDVNLIKDYFREEVVEV